MNIFKKTVFTKDNSIFAIYLLYLILFHISKLGFLLLYMLLPNKLLDISINTCKKIFNWH